MVKLRVTKVTGEILEYKVTPVIEFSFEQYAKKGFQKAFLEDQKQSDVYWLAWEAMRRDGITVPTFGASFLETLEKVDIVVEEDNPNS